MKQSRPIKAETDEAHDHREEEYQLEPDEDTERSIINDEYSESACSVKELEAQGSPADSPRV